jgi:hypothetical protein
VEKFSPLVARAHALARQAGFPLTRDEAGPGRPSACLPRMGLSGASGSGKSTVTGPLRRQLPDCEIFETDALLHVAALGLDTWG